MADHASRCMVGHNLDCPLTGNRIKYGSQLLKASYASCAQGLFTKNPSQNALRGVFGGATGNRTRDTRIFSPLLYQLSYGTRFSFELPYLSIGIAKVDIIF